MGLYWYVVKKDIIMNCWTRCSSTLMSYKPIL